MKSKKMLYIRKCYFNLPDDFDGTFAEALMLMANRAAQAEAYNEISTRQYYEDANLYEYLVNADKSKCVVDYEFI